jgi:hypothetical protein
MGEEGEEVVIVCKTGCERIIIIIMDKRTVIDILFVCLIIAVVVEFLFRTFGEFPGYTRNFSSGYTFIYSLLFLRRLYQLKTGSLMGC